MPDLIYLPSHGYLARTPLIAPRRDPPPERVVAILREVARAHGVSVGDLIGESRRRRISHARQEAMWRLWHMTLAGGLRGRPSKPQIGKWLGRDHSTVWHGILAHEKRVGRQRSRLVPAAIYQGEL